MPNSEWYGLSRIRLNSMVRTLASHPWKSRELRAVGWPPRALEDTKVVAAPLDGAVHNYTNKLTGHDDTNKCKLQLPVSIQKPG